MFNYSNEDVKTSQIQFLEGTINEVKFNDHFIYLDHLVIKRSEKSLLSILSRIRTDLKVMNKNIHFIGLSGIHYIVVIKHFTQGVVELIQHVLPIKKSRDELVLKTMLILSNNSDISELTDICEKVIHDHSIIKKNIRIYKDRRYYYRLLISEVDQEVLDKFCINYGINTKLDIGNYSRLAVIISNKMDSMGVEHATKSC